MILSIKNAHPFDSRIKFQKDGHRYWIDNNDKYIISSTSFIKQFFKEFDSDSVIKNILNSYDYKHNPEHKYYKMSAQEIKNLWDSNGKTARDMGTSLHEDIENYYNGIKVDNNSVEFKHFLNFVEDEKLKIYRTEWFIFSELHRITGSIDAIFENEDGTLSIYDWKRSKEIHMKSFNDEKGKSPLDTVPDINYYHYSLQLNLYKSILERYYGKKIKDMFLIILHPDNSNYQKIKVLDMEKEINLILEYRLNQIKTSPSKIETQVCRLSEKQKDALNKITKGYNVFLTGPGGCGKSTIIKLFYNDYKDCKNIGITSTTGTSAILIGGVTLHSFLGIGLGKDSVESLYLKIKKKAYMFKRWRDLDTLIIDEISMLSPQLFDKLELLARKLRNNELPFGGIQLVLTGDFLQLPCVETEEFCFQAKSWDKCVKYPIYLTEIFRQDNNNFQKCLNEVRVGKLSKESIDILKSRVNIDLVNSNGIIPTKIYSLNVDVDNENQKELDKLSSKNTNLEFFEYELEANILKKNLKFVDEKIKKNCVAPQNLQLCIGAQVMLLYNIDLEMGLANGSRGIITKFEDNLPVVKFINGVECSIDYQEWVIEENGEKIISITQIPLKVAYAITVHKSQGLTIDFAELDLSDIFEYGQAYVALSRVKNLEGLSIKNLNIRKIIANKKAVEYYENL